MKKSFLQLTGWVGMILILLAYFLLSFSVIESGSITYQVLNLLGALGIVIETFSKKDYQPMVLNMVWVMIALIAIVRSLL